MAGVIWGPALQAWHVGWGLEPQGLLEYLSLCLRGLPNLAALAVEQAQSERKERKRQVEPLLPFPGPALEVICMTSATSCSFKASP